MQPINSCNFLFWNINKKPLFNEISEIVYGHNIDIVILAEFPKVKEIDLLLKLNQKQTIFFPPHPSALCEKIKIYTRFHFDFIRPVYEDHRMTIRELKFPIGSPILLVGIHFLDKGNHSAESQSEESSIVIQRVKEIELKLKNSRTIIVGDFNMNPFETGMIKANGFHATMSSLIAKKQSRTIQSNDYGFFYNPMWSLFGDLNDTVAGTYYYSHAEHISYHWNVFDQVILRPDLIDDFDKKSLKILESTTKTKLTTLENLPDKNNFSDHLPIIFTLKI